MAPPAPPLATQLLALCVLQVLCLVWMHHAATRRNLRRLRRYVACHDAEREPDGGLWVHGRPVGFRLCRACVDALLCE